MLKKIESTFKVHQANNQKEIRYLNKKKLKPKIVNLINLKMSISNCVGEIINKKVLGYLIQTLKEQLSFRTHQNLLSKP